MTQSSPDDDQKVESNTDRQRSPAYPSISLQDAITKTRVLHDADKGGATPMDVAASHLGMSPKSSGFMQGIASMVRYGLLDEVGGKPRRLKPSKDAMDILLLPETDQKHRAAVRRAALRPSLFNELWAAHRAAMPSDQTLIHELVTSRQFRQDAAKEAVKHFKNAVAFAKVSDADNIVNPSEDVILKVGDFIQWESQGALQFPEPRRVVSLSDDGAWVFVGESPAGIDRKQVKKVEAPKAETMTSQPPAVSGVVTPPPNLNYKPASSVATAKQDVFTTDTGEVVVRWPAVLSSEDFEDIEGWLDMLKRKIKRSVKSDAPDGQN